MRPNRFLIYFINQLIVIVAVVASFKLISDKSVAATLAGAFFVGVPLVQMIDQYRRARFENVLWFIGVLQFWVIFALPIFGIRVFNWGAEFETLSFLGIPGPLLHEWSSKSYMVMVVITGWFWLKTRKK